MRKAKTYVIALGGNSILRRDERGYPEEQYLNLERTCEQLLELFTEQNRIVITHGNGPQVGNLLLAFEAAKDVVPPMPLDICVAATQGLMGYMLQNTLANHLRKAGLNHKITTVVAEVIVNKNDPAFRNPTKPVGPFYNSIEAEKLYREKGWVIIEDSAHRFRRVVPSPRPISIQQARIIKTMLDAGEIVIAIGGGGIPVVREEDGSLQGVEAVVDKDLASSCLAVELGADIFFILTAVENVYRDFRLSSQKALDYLDLTEAKELLLEGQFEAGSMEPKIRAAIEFLEKIDGEVIISQPEKVTEALQGKGGTQIKRTLLPARKGVMT